MARILVADYGREDLLALESPLVWTLRAWGHEVIEAEDSVDVLQQMHAAPPDAVILYDTLPEMEWLHTTLYCQGATQGMPILTLHEKLQQMQFTDMIVVDPRYRLGKSRRQFDADELRKLLEEAGI
jgi:DNA-binding response OmpR family regulator